MTKEIRSSNVEGRSGVRWPDSSFGFRYSFGFRHSSFGFSACLGCSHWFPAHDQRVRDFAFVPVTRMISHLAVVPQCGRSAAIQIHSLLATEFDQVRGKLVEVHADRNAFLAAIHRHEKEITFIPADRRSGMALHHRAELIGIRIRSFKTLPLSVPHQYGPSADRGPDASQARLCHRGDAELRSRFNPGCVLN